MLSVDNFLFMLLFKSLWKTELCNVVDRLFPINGWSQRLIAWEMQKKWLFIWVHCEFTIGMNTLSGVKCNGLNRIICIFIQNIHCYFLFGSELILLVSFVSYVYKKSFTYSLNFCVPNSDIGLVKLPEPVTFNELVQPIPFACSSSSDGGEVAIAIGNGMRSDNDRLPPSHLQYVELQTISNLSCLKTFPFLVFRKSIVCVQGEEQRSICDGDSGGPLMLSSDNTLLGIVSFGRRTCQDGSAQVFTRVSQYTEWIEEVSGVKCKK